MSTKETKFNSFYMLMADQCADLSYCKRKKVGAIIVKDGNILSYSYNGTPHSFDNDCEEDDKTKPEVIHAEVNAICKIAKSTNSCEDATLYVTLSPCIECAKMIIQSGIKQVYYKDLYRIEDGIELIKKAGIKINQLL